MIDAATDDAGSAGTHEAESATAASTSDDRTGPVATSPVTFRVPAALARHAQLIGEFTSWTPLAMDRLDDGSHVLRLRLPAGCDWRYQFVLDDSVTVNDPDAEGYLPGPGYGHVSVVRT